MKKNSVRLGLVLLLTLVFLFFFFRSVEWKKVLGYLTDVNLKFFILLIVLLPVHLVTRSIRWRYLLMHEKRDVKFFNMFAANSIGFTVTLIFPGRLGELVKPLYLARKEKMSKGFVLGTVVVERIFDIFTMCSLLGLFILIKPFYSSYFQANEEAYVNLQMYGIIGVAFATFFLAVILSLYFFKEKTLSIIAFFLKPFPHKLSQRILRLSEEFIKGLKFFHSVGNLLIYIFLSFVVWLSIVFYYWMLFFTYKISISYFLLFPFVFLTMVGASIPLPGMVGGYHYFCKLALTSIYGIDLNLAVSMTIVIHAIQVVVTCLIGYAILLNERISLCQIQKSGEAVE